MKWKGLHLGKQSLFISMLYLLLSIVIMGLGINLVAHANLGTSALTSIPLVMNELVPLTFGELTMIFNIILVISQVILLGKELSFVAIFSINCVVCIRSFSRFLGTDDSKSWVESLSLATYCGCYRLFHHRFEYYDTIESRFCE